MVTNAASTYIVSTSCMPKDWANRSPSAVDTCLSSSGSKVYLVTYQHRFNVFSSQLFSPIIPSLDMFKWLSLGKIVYQYSSLGSSIVACRDSRKSFLTSSLPYFQLTNSPVHSYHATVVVNTYCLRVAIQKNILWESSEQSWFPHGRVADHQYLERIISRSPFTHRYIISIQVVSNIQWSNIVETRPLTSVPPKTKHLLPITNNGVTFKWNWTQLVVRVLEIIKKLYTIVTC